nr:hypothetical protein [uncultured Flavobacterium sp.]
MKYLKFIFAFIIVCYLVYYYALINNPDWFERFVAIAMWILMIPTALRFFSKNDINFQ